MGPSGPVQPLSSGHTPLTAHWVHAPALDSLMGRHVHLLRHVAKGAVNAWGKACAQVVHDFLGGPSWETLAALLAFPKCTLGLPNRGGKKNKGEASRLVRQRILSFQDKG